jgi:hypothetical protein
MGNRGDRGEGDRLAVDLITQIAGLIPSFFFWGGGDYDKVRGRGETGWGGGGGEQNRDTVFLLPFDSFEWLKICTIKLLYIYLTILVLPLSS